MRRNAGRVTSAVAENGRQGPVERPLADRRTAVGAVCLALLLCFAYAHRRGETPDTPVEPDDPAVVASGPVDAATHPSTAPPSPYPAGARDFSAEKPVVPANISAAEEHMNAFRIPPGCARLVNASLSNTWFDDSYETGFDYRPPDPSRGKSLPVAVCMSGGLRTFHKVVHLINRTLVGPNDADVFMHATVQPGGTQEAIDLLSKIPWIKAFVIDVQKTFVRDAARRSTVGLPDYDSWLRECGGERAMHINKHLPMFRKIHMCDRLVRQYEQHHAVRYATFVRSRPDLVPTLRCETANLTCPRDTLCVHQRRILAHQWQFAESRPNCDLAPYANYTADCPFCCEFCSDFFALGDRDIMRTYADVVFKFPDWPPVFGTRGGHREVMILWALRELGIRNIRASSDVLRTAQPWLVRETDDIRRAPICAQLLDSV